MESESTLERKDRMHAEHLKKAIENGYNTEAVDKIFNLTLKSKVAVDCLRSRAKDIAKTIQPSILDKDLRLAVNMMSAMATQLVLNLLNDDLIKINE